jgi:flagellar basal body rod protein FlgB
MNLMPLITDNIAELLVKIIEFTQSRQKILAQNINNIHSPGFVPKDLAVEEFCDSLSNAIYEHLRSQRLLFCDTRNIKFGAGGGLEVHPTIDKYAQKLLEENREGYYELQINKLLENSINQRVAAALLRQKQEVISIGGNGIHYEKKAADWFF